MTSKYDGGPAFPLDGANRGASLRDFFAAHAPSEIPDWFEGPKPPIPVRPGIPEEIAEAVHAWQLEDDADYLEEYLSKDAPETHIALAQQYQSDLSAYFAARSSYQKDVSTSSYFAWRYYYADMMLAQRGREVE